MKQVFYSDVALTLPLVLKHYTNFMEFVSCNPIRACSVSHPIAMENIQSMFYVPESEDLKDESSAVKKQWSIILQEGLSELEDHHCKSLNTLGDAINSRLDAFIDLNAEMDSYH